MNKAKAFSPVVASNASRARKLLSDLKKLRAKTPSPPIPVWLTLRGDTSLPLLWTCQCGASAKSRSWTGAMRAAQRHCRSEHKADAEIIQ